LIAVTPFKSGIVEPLFAQRIGAGVTSTAKWFKIYLCSTVLLGREEIH
jgi:hypothetical protein